MNKWYQKLKRREAQRKRPRLPKPDLSFEQILSWADAHHERTGKWPKRNEDFWAKRTHATVLAEIRRVHHVGSRLRRNRVSVRRVMVRARAVARA